MDTEIEINPWVFSLENPVRAVKSLELWNLT